MIERDDKLKRPAEIIREEIKLAPGETKQARFVLWLAEKLTPPRFCNKHPRTQLACDQSRSGIWAAIEESAGPPFREIPDSFTFRAALRCPACICAHALCPPEMHESSFEDFKTDTQERSRALAACRQFVAQVQTNGKGFALFVGLAGTGKTRLATNIIREARFPSALYVRQAQLTVALRATYGRRSAEYDDDGQEIEPVHPLSVVQGEPLLVLDEIGCAALANDDRAFLDELIKHRYDAAKPTILISNLPFADLKQFLGDALSDRIRHATGNGKFILQFSGGSFRGMSGEDYLCTRPAKLSQH